MFKSDGNYTAPESELHDALVRLCQAAGFTTQHTYELIRQVVASVQMETPEPLTFTLLVDGTIASLIDPEGDDMPLAEAEGATPDEAVRNLIDKVTFEGEAGPQALGKSPGKSPIDGYVAEVHQNPLLSRLTTDPQGDEQ